MTKQFLLTGGSGMIGSEIMRHLSIRGYKVNNLSTKPSSNPQTFLWNPNKNELDMNALKDVDTIIHLAGATIAKRWTKRYKKEILESRIQSTRVLREAISSLPVDQRPKSLICASAVGLYPNDQNKVYSEDDPGGDGFLATVINQWEQEIFKSENLGMRVCCLRIGIVLGKGGGVLDTLLPFFKLGLGSPLGNGKQWMPWIHISDLARQFLCLAENSKYQGIFLGVGSESVTNREFSQALASKINRPYFLPPIPAFVLYSVLGPMAELALMSTRCSSLFWKNEGFEYQYQTLNHALDDLI